MHRLSGKGLKVQCRQSRKMWKRCNEAGGGRKRQNYGEICRLGQFVLSAEQRAATKVF